MRLWGNFALTQPHRGMLTVACLAMAAAIVIPVVPAGAAGTVEVVATNLNNPRGLAFGPGGQLYVAEAGRGGTVAAPDGSYIGVTGSISVIPDPTAVHPSVRRITTGLMSVAEGDGGISAIGADGIAVTPSGKVVTIMGAAAAQVPDSGIPPKLATVARAQLGRLLAVNRDGTTTTLADVGGYDYTWTGDHADAPWAPTYDTPDGPVAQFPDANPYAVIAVPGHVYVADAGANTVNEVRGDGSVRVLSYIPNPGVSDAVPTCLAQGPDGALYVGTLAIEAGPGAGSVYRIDPKSKAGFLHNATLWATGFTAITGCGFGSDGSFYVTEFYDHFTDQGPAGGDVVMVPFAHPDRGRVVLGSGELNTPSGFAAGTDGSIYVSNWSILPGASDAGVPGGQVVRITA